MIVNVPILECSQCHEPWALRLAHRFAPPPEGDGFVTEWLYVRDCKCWVKGTRERPRCQVRGSERSPETAPLIVPEIAAE